MCDMLADGNWYSIAVCLQRPSDKWRLRSLSLLHEWQTPGKRCNALFQLSLFISCFGNTSSMYTCTHTFAVRSLAVVWTRFICHFC